MSRFLISLILACGFCSAAVAEEPWIIDPHTHFKGPAQIAHESQQTKRHPDDSLGKVILPEDYRSTAKRLNIQATLVVEAVDQDQPQFNDWLLSKANSDLVCGYVARGDLTSESFQANYQRYRGTGYLNGYRFRFEELREYLDDATALQNLAVLQRDGMVVDLLIEWQHTSDVAQLAKAFPQLRIVINHCFRAKLKEGKMSDEWKLAVKTCAAYPNVCCKVSSILNFSEARPFIEKAPSDLQFYLPVLDPVFDAFGEDRVIFATNWGVSAHFGKVDHVVRIVREFLESKGPVALRKGMRSNAIRIYRIRADLLAKHKIQ